MSLFYRHRSLFCRPVTRIGQNADKILCYSFLPAEGVERIINLRGVNWDDHQVQGSALYSPHPNPPRYIGEGTLEVVLSFDEQSLGV